MVTQPPIQPLQPHIARAAVVLLDTRISGKYPTRAEIAAAGVPTAEQAKGIALRLSQASGLRINPMSLRLAVALLQSGVTIDAIRYAAREV